MLAIHHVTKRYGKKVIANDDISFTVQDGKITILLGPNGAGKSTIIKCIAGLLRFQGEIQVDGHANKTSAAKRQLGYIPELPAIYDLLTVEEHLHFIARAYQLQDYQTYAQELLCRLEMDDKRKKLGSELSKGMQQKLSIIMGLLPQPHNIIFDEPLVGLDPHAIKEIKNIFRELKAAGCAILISTHMLDSVEDYWDTAHIMMEGRFAATMEHQEQQHSKQSLESLFFAITEKHAEASTKEEA